MAVTCNPSLVVVWEISSITVSREAKGLARQLMEMKEKSRCSILFHSRSGWETPSIAFLFTLSEYPSSCRSSASAVFLMVCPCLDSPFTKCARERVVHFTKLIGSPLGSNSSSRSRCKLGSVATTFFLPPPALRILPSALGISPLSSLTLVGPFSNPLRRGRPLCQCPHLRS